ncbi:hypothetical protein ACFQZ4_49145 [Catellatospora coxensis]
MTVSVGELSMGQTLRPARVKPEADLVVTVAGPARGQVGEVAMFEWTLANVGLDPVWESAGLVKLTAPAGTEFPPLAQIAVPDDLTCNPAPRPRLPSVAGSWSSSPVRPTPGECPGR